MTHMFLLALLGFLCLSCSNMEDPFASIKQIHQAPLESIDRKQNDPLFFPEQPEPKAGSISTQSAPHYFWEEKEPSTQ